MVRSIFVSFGAIFLLFESYEVFTDANITFSLLHFMLIGLMPGVMFFFLNGYQISGFLRREVEINAPGSATKISVKFGDLFLEDGWKAVGVNDFFDNVVDDELVSSTSLHGKVISNYWKDNKEDWKKQIESCLRSHQGNREPRPKGNQTRYPIGTTARASIDQKNFLFVALGETNVSDSTTWANAEMLIKAIRGLAVEARAACSLEPLSIPLMGSGLSRVEMKPSVLVDLIVTAILEESRQGKITKEIRIILPHSLAHEINLKDHVAKWS